MSKVKEQSQQNVSTNGPAGSAPAPSSPAPSSSKPATGGRTAPTAAALVDQERVIGMDFIRATEAAALSAYKWMGKGDKESADFAACDAIRGLFDTVNICGTVTIGEGIKDDAPGIFKG